MSLSAIQFSPGSWVVPAVDWMNIHFHSFFTGINVAVSGTLETVNSLLLWLPPWVLIAIVVVASFLAVGWQVAALCAGSLFFCLTMGLWEQSIETITLVILSVLISLMIAFPCGILASRVRALETVLRPVLDMMQTVPPWVYLIPAVILFSLGSVPAVIATVVYATPPMLRLTILAFRQVPKDLLELGQSVGASRWQSLIKIEFPAAKPTLMVGLNQCILLSLAMVVLAGLVGASGLGSDVTIALMRMEMGLGLRSGLAVVAVAILLDHLTSSVLQRQRRIGRGN